MAEKTTLKALVTTKDKKSGATNTERVSLQPSSKEEMFGEPKYSETIVPKKKYSETIVPKMPKQNPDAAKVKVKSDLKQDTVNWLSKMAEKYKRK